VERQSLNSGHRSRQAAHNDVFYMELSGRRNSGGRLTAVSYTQKLGDA